MTDIAHPSQGRPLKPELLARLRSGDYAVDPLLVADAIVRRFALASQGLEDLDVLEPPQQDPSSGGVL